MRFSKPFTYFVCLLNCTSVFAAEALPQNIPIGVVSNPAPQAAAAPAPQATIMPAFVPAPAPAAKPAPAKPAIKTVVKIASFDGKLNPNHKSEIQLRPGRKVTLTADHFATVKGKLVAQKADARDFIWQIDNEICDMGRSGNCLNSGIEATKDGITFVLPHNMPRKMTVIVRDAADSKKSDKMVIRNQTIVEQEALSARLEAEYQAEQAQMEQDQRNRAIFGAILGIAAGAAIAYGSYRAEKQIQDRRDEDRNRRQQEESRRNAPVPQAPAPAPQAPAPQAPANPPHNPGHGGFGGNGGGPRGDGQGRGQPRPAH